MAGQWLSVTDINFKCQILALGVVAIIIYDFIRSKRLPLRSTRLFRFFLAMGAFNLVTDIVTYYTLLNYKLVPPVLNRVPYCNTSQIRMPPMLVRAAST